MRANNREVFLCSEGNKSVVDFWKMSAFVLRMKVGHVRRKKAPSKFFWDSFRRTKCGDSRAAPLPILSKRLFISWGFLPMGPAAWASLCSRTGKFGCGKLFADRGSGHEVSCAMHADEEK
jgi:hypothetical protein